VRPSPDTIFFTPYNEGNNGSNISQKMRTFNQRRLSQLTSQDTEAFTSKSTKRRHSLTHSIHSCINSIYTDPHSVAVVLITKASSYISYFGVTVSHSVVHQLLFVDEAMQMLVRKTWQNTGRNMNITVKLNNDGVIENAMVDNELKERGFCK